jgi:AcrR family transcriptional regulator
MPEPVLEDAGREAARTSIRARARRAVQAEVAEIAFDLFLDHGFEQTTVDQITAAAGISRSSFFRYFPAKEDVVIGTFTDWGLQVARALENRPDTEPPWLALQRATEPILQESSAKPGRALRATRMLLDTPALRARHYEKTLHWQDLLAPEIARRLGLAPDDRTDPRPQALVSAWMACLDAATLAWANSDGRANMTDLLATAMNAIG